MIGLFQTMQWLPFGKYIIELSPNSYGVCFHHKMTINQSLFLQSHWPGNQAVLQQWSRYIWYRIYSLWGRLLLGIQN